MKKHWTIIVPGAVLLCAAPTWAVDLRTAVQAALNTNPDIRQAIHNKAATQYERKQAKGLYYPTVSTELSAGVRELKNPSRRRIGLGNNTLYPAEGVDAVRVGDDGGAGAGDDLEERLAVPADGELLVGGARPRGQGHDGEEGGEVAEHECDSLGMHRDNVLMIPEGCGGGQGAAAEKLPVGREWIERGRLRCHVHAQDPVAVGFRHQSTSR